MKTTSTKVNKASTKNTTKVNKAAPSKAALAKAVATLKPTNKAGKSITEIFRKATVEASAILKPICLKVAKLYGESNEGGALCPKTNAFLKAQLVELLGLSTTRAATIICEAGYRAKNKRSDIGKKKSNKTEKPKTELEKAIILTASLKAVLKKLTPAQKKKYAAMDDAFKF